MKTKKAVILLSGGIDSSTCAAQAQADGFEIYCLSFDYSQRNLVELESAKKVAQKLKAKAHKILKLDLRAFGGSALTSEIKVPKNRIISEAETEIPVTYVPARNLIFLSIAGAYAETLGVFDIFIGVNAVDYSGYPDCRPEFISSFEQTLNLGTKAGVTAKTHFKIHTPLQNMSKVEIIKLGTALGVDYSMTMSCYDPVVRNLGKEHCSAQTPEQHSVFACGKCDACIFRANAFKEANIPDPTIYC